MKHKKQISRGNKLLRLITCGKTQLFTICLYCITHELRRTVTVAVDIFLKAFVGNIHFAKRGKYFFGTGIVEPVEEMKNKSSRRTLPLPDPVYEMLCEEREKQDLYRRMFKGSYNRKFDDYICVDQLGELLRPNRVTQRFADLIERYGLRKIRFHDRRHTFASILINQDVPLLNVSTFLGHSDLATTANIYAHLDKSKKQESADIISNIFNKAKE